jgi:ABC transporter with metal-binding/Fe-S-binding domain ATP-binding protein
MKAVACFSGGKDSTYAAFLALQMGFEIEQALIFIPESRESYMFHSPNIVHAGTVAGCMGLEPVIVEVHGDELACIARAFEAVDADYIITGAIASEYQHERFGYAAYSAGKHCISPLWRRNQLSLLREIVDAGMRVIFVGVFAEGLSSEWLGRELDKATIEKLKELQEKYGVNPSGEGGEYETLVVDAPFFTRKIEIGAVEVTADATSARAEIKSMWTMPK